MYELLVAINPDIDKSRLETILQKIEEPILKNEGRIVAGGLWGRKRFAARIKKKNEGLYYLYYFYAPAHTLNEIDAVLKLDPNVLLRLFLNIPEKFVNKIKIWPKENRFEKKTTAAETVSSEEPKSEESETKAEKAQSAEPAETPDTDETASESAAPKEEKNETKTESNETETAKTEEANKTEEGPDEKGVK